MREVVKIRKRVWLTARRFGRLRLAIPIASVCLAIIPSAFAVPVDIGSAADYAVVGVGGSVSIQSDFSIYQSATVINGNVAQGPYTDLTHSVDATVNGRWDYDNTDSAPFLGSGGSVTGGFVQKDLSGVAADARAASATAAALIPDVTFATLTEGQTINATGMGLYVVRITDPVGLKTTLTLAGGATDQIVFQLTTAESGHVLDLGGLVMSLTGGITAGNVLWNLAGDTDGDIAIHADAFVAGTILAPDRSLVSTHGHFDGAVIAGGSGHELDIHSGSQVNQPAAVPDGGSTCALLGFALIGLSGLRKKFKI